MVDVMLSESIYGQVRHKVTAWCFYGSHSFCNVRETKFNTLKDTEFGSRVLQYVHGGQRGRRRGFEGRESRTSGVNLHAVLDSN